MAAPVKKRPWLKFYPQDWRGDPKLRMCSIGARGLWAEMICLMHEADPYGHLLINAVPVTNRQLASLAGIPQADCMKFMLELESSGVYSRAVDNTIYSRRMVRDGVKADEGKTAVERKWASPERAEPLTRSQRLAAARRKGKHSIDEWLALVDVCGNRCVCCGGNENGKGVVKDHIVPIYQGGSDAIENLQPMCQPCNAGKGADSTDHRPRDWEKRLGERLGKRLGETPLTSTETPSLYARDQNSNGTGKRASLISPEAFEITGALEQACGFMLPEETPVGWAGCAMWVQKCLNEGWVGEVMVNAAGATARKKRNGFIESYRYLEKPLAEAMAVFRTPVSKVEIREGETVSVTANRQGSSGSSAHDAIARLRARVESPRDGDNPADPNVVRLLSQG